MFDFMDSSFDDAAPSGEQTKSGLYIPDATECMRCGQCVSACPTFKLFQTDAETPRQRLRSISKILVHNQTISSAEQQHLDNCVQCRACEPRCPSQVRYGALFDEAQFQLKFEKKPSFWSTLAFKLIEQKNWRHRLMPLLAMYHGLRLYKPLRATGLLRKLGLAEAESLLTKPSLGHLAQCYPYTTTQQRGRVALFTGCVAENFDRATLHSAIKLLNAIGYEVLVTPTQACCGAVHQHNGQSAAELIAQNIAAFDKLNIEAIVYTATGCGAMLTEYPAASETGTQFQQRLQDVNHFILAHWPTDLSIAASNLKVAVHEPCSQRNVLKNTADVYALLAKIPDLTITALADNEVCCGAGGSYMLTHPDNAHALRVLKQNAIALAQADVVVSSNFGCTLFLNAGQKTIEIVHPLQFLAGQLFK